METIHSLSNSSETHAQLASVHREVETTQKLANHYLRALLNELVTPREEQRTIYNEMASCRA
jgi:hypothetical protein